VAVQNGIFVEFTDPEMRDALHQHQLVANPLQIKAIRLHALETRLQNEGTNELLFTNEADVHMLLSCLQPAAHSQQVLQILKIVSRTRTEGKHRRQSDGCGHQDPGRPAILQGVD
jgi:hypothetical protein